VNAPVPINVGLLGLGTVGGGVAQALAAKQKAIAAHVGCPIRVTHVLVRDALRERRVAGGAVITSDPDEILDDPDVRIVVEVMGGETPALDYVQRAIHAGKHVVTANKELMAKHGPEILANAAEHHVSVQFEGSVGGGIPIIGPLVRDLLANDITAVNAIINGTTNFMLTSMAGGDLDYASALRRAQELGYAEADPANDVDGIDAAYKLAILASLAFRTRVHADDVYREGIGRLTSADFRYAEELGYVIKLLAIGRRNGSTAQVRVHPALVPAEHPLAKVDGVLNAVELEGDLVGWAMFQGPGAGSDPTASAVVGDILEIARALAGGGCFPVPPALDGDVTLLPMADIETQYYLRLRAADRPGVMAQVAQVLGDRQVSLASVIQKEPPRSDGSAEIVITTHTAREAAVQEAVHAIEGLESVIEVSNLIRIEDGAR
jgi:homoserine dehydrogenase